MKPNFMHNHQLKIETITPVSIGHEGVLSPYGDFVIKGNKVHYVDQKVLEEALKDPKLIDQYVEGIRVGIDQSATKSDFDLANFLPNFLGLMPIDYAKETYNVFGLDTVDSRVRIKTIVHNAGTPYLPGSSIKGAIKTAILYDWLSDSDSEKSRKVLEQLISKINYSFSSVQEYVNRYNELMEEQNDFGLDKTQKKEVNDCLDKIKFEGKKLSTSISKFSVQLFGDIQQTNKNRTRMDFSLMRISDTQLFHPNAKEIHQTQRFNILTNSSGIPELKETIKTKEQSNFQINIIPQFSHKYLQYLNSNDITLLFEVINYFSYENLSYNYSTIKDQLKNAAPKNKDVYKKLMKFYDRLMNDLDKIEENNEFCYLRIGSGKTYFTNSIGLAIHNKNKSSFYKLCKLLNLGNFTTPIFPITRTVCMHGYQQLGWVKISKV